jgi:hypothetical protein
MTLDEVRSALDALDAACTIFAELVARGRWDEAEAFLAELFQGMGLDD